jgi:hypothetical protein
MRLDETRKCFTLRFPSSLNKITFLEMCKKTWALDQWPSGQSSWLLPQRIWVRFQALPNFSLSKGSGTGSAQSHEDKKELFERKERLWSRKLRLTTVGDPSR